MKALLPALLSLLLLLTGCQPAREVSAPAEIEAPKYVALTFDDGPRRDTTQRLLRGLRQRNVKATFFVIGEQIPGNEDLLRKMAADGHQIGSHTYTHARLTALDSAGVTEEIQKTEVLLREAAGPGDYWLRPPYGLMDSRRAKLVDTPMVYWSVDPQDWKVLDARLVTDHVLSHVHPGDIVLLHDFYPSSVEAALHIVDRLQAGGWEFVTVEELFRLENVIPLPGRLYATPTRERQIPDAA